MAALASPTIASPEEDQQQDHQQDPPLTEQGDDWDDAPSYDFYMEFMNDLEEHEIPPFPTETTVLSVLPWQALPGVPGLNVDINALEPEVHSPWRFPCRRGTRVIISTPFIPVHVTFAHRVTRIGKFLVLVEL